MKKLCVLLCLVLSLCIHAESTIPVLDMRQFYNPFTREQFVQELSDAFHEVGFVAITNTGVDAKTIEKAYSAAKEFFALDLATKQRYVNRATNGQRGYVLSEKAKGMQKFDHKEFFHMGRILSEEQKNRLNYYEDIWPQEVDFRKTIYPLFEELESYLVPLEQAMAKALNIT